jgi:hypothetical protein
MFRRILAISMLATPMAHAGSGPFGIDHEWSFNQSGIWARKYQTGLEVGVITVEVGGALWLGNDDTAGHVFWQSIDASVVAGVTSFALKKATGRARPGQGNNPSAWFKGNCCESFPSGEVTLQASFVTPFIAHYAHDHPLVWALEILPVYDGMARMKSQAHWQSDVIAAWLLGTGAGYWATTRSVPLSVQILPGGVSVGIVRRF